MKTVTAKKLTDEEVIDKYLATQSAVYFSILYDRYITKVYSKSISLLKDEVRAQDAAQEIFIKIFTNLAKFNKKSKFSTWVYSITYNFCIDVIRKSKKKNKLFSDEEAEGKEIIEEVDDKVLLEMELERLKIVLDLLNVDDKAVLIMKYKEGLSIREISE
ncbi:MAG: RNA polymerase sigma-70 factor (ECF subfamily), partial [Saprospiraceae bacterium]